MTDTTPPSAQAIADIPSDLLPLYAEAAASCKGLPWQVLAAVGKVETDHGRSTLPGVHSGANYAGAMGPMQFLAPTWSAYGIDGDHDGAADVYSSTDAVWGAANYLCRSGAGDPARLHQAIWAYNHSEAYIAKVLAQAAAYGAGSDPSAPGGLTTVEGITVATSIAPQVDALLRAAAADGISLGGGGYRSFEQQIEARRRNGCPDIYTSPASSCRVPTARPGQSMHEQGLAIDFTYGGGIIGSRNSPAFAWLAQNAASFRLYNLPPEPWHWSTNAR